MEEKKIKKEDFMITENYHTRLGDDVVKKLIEKINSNFNARYNYKNDEQYSYSVVLQDNLQQLSNFVLEKKKEFNFIIPKMNLNRLASIINLNQTDYSPQENYLKLFYSKLVLEDILFFHLLSSFNST